MTWVVMVLAVTASAVAQSLLPGWPLLGGARPPLLLGAVLYYGLQRAAGVMTAAAVFAGFLQDALGGVPLGWSTAFFCAAAWAVASFRLYLNGEAAVTHGVLGAAGAGALSLLTYGVLLRGGQVEWTPLAALHHAAGSAAWGLAAVPAMVAFLRALDGAVGNVDVKEGVRGFR